MALITIPKLITKAQTIFNRYIRQRDSEDGYFTCISCGHVKAIDLMDAGHYVPVKGSSALRFDEYNVNGECKRCNGFDQFHLIGYRRNLIDKVGERKVKELEQQHRLIKKWSRYELQAIIEYYGEINK